MNVSTTVRRLLAAAMVVQPLLILINMMLHPTIPFTAAGILAGAAENPTTWYVGHMIAALGSLMIVPAVLGLRTLVRERGRRVADIGVWAGIVAAVTMGLFFGIEASVMRLAVSSGLDAAGALAITQASMNAPEFFAFPVGLLSYKLAVVLLLSTLLVVGVVPRWQAGLYLVGTVASLAGGPGSPVGLIAFGIVTIAAAFLARHVVRGDAEPAPSSTPTALVNPHVAHA